MDRVEYQSIIVQDILNLEKADELDLAPWYQRRSVWSSAQKSYLINTLFEKKPIPAVYIRHSLDMDKGKSIKEVVDGQQRLRTIIEYCKDGYAARHPEHKRKVKFSELNKAQRHNLLMTSIPVGYLLGATDADVIDIFGRINSVSKSLNAQEKRNAKFSGEFKQLCLHQASSRIELWRSYRIFTANDIARMNEVQFISDIVVNLINGLSDYKPKVIDELYEKYDEEFDLGGEIGQRLDRVFDFIASLEPGVIVETIFRRQPLFFSLIIVIDSLEDLDVRKAENALVFMDARFNSEENQTEEDVEFVKACTSTTQRIAQRKIRDAYIRKYF